MEMLKILFFSGSKMTAVLSIGHRIECYSEDGNKFIAKVISRAGKATGAHKHAYNIEQESGDVSWIDLSKHVEKWRELPDDEEILVVNNSGDTLSAKKAEIDNWKCNEVYEEVEDSGQTALSLRWVLTEI